MYPDDNCPSLKSTNITCRICHDVKRAHPIRAVREWIAWPRKTCRTLADSIQACAVITRTSTMLLEGLRDSADKSAWQEFDGRYRPLLLAVGRRLGLSITDAEDAAQDCLAAVVVEYREGQYQRETGRLRDWLAGVMAHKVRDVQRRLHRQKALGREAVDDAAELIEDKSIREAIEAEWSASVLRQCIEQVRREVTPVMFDSFELFALQQTPADEVARRLGISADLVYQNKRRVLVRIRELMPQIEEIW